MGNVGKWELGRKSLNFWGAAAPEWDEDFPGGWEGVAEHLGKIWTIHEFYHFIVQYCKNHKTFHANFQLLYFSATFLGLICCYTSSIYYFMQLFVVFFRRVSGQP